MVTTVLSANAVITTFCRMFSCKGTSRLQEDRGADAESRDSKAPLTHRGHVYGRRGFVHDEDAALPHKRSGQTEELPLADAEVLPAFRHHGIWTQESAREVFFPLVVQSHVTRNEHLVLQEAL